MQKAIIILGLLIFSAPGAFAQEQLAPVPVEMTVEKWREDLRYLAAEMPRVHKNMFHSVTQEEFNAAVTRLDERLPSLPRNQILVEFARLVAMVGDGHTSIQLFTDPKLNFHAFPLSFCLYKDGLFVRSAKSEYAQSVGAKLLKVGKVPAEEAYKVVRELVSRDNEMGVKEGAPHLLSMPEILNGLGLIDSTESVQYTLEANGKQIVVDVKAVLVSEIMAHLRTGAGNWIDARDGAKAPTPLWLKDPQNNYWFEYLTDSRTLYVKYNAVQNKPDESIADFFKRVFAFGESNPVDRFVIDMRNNDGGNNALNWPIIYGLIRSDKLNQRGKLFVIIGRETFSAAQNGVNQLERHTNAIFVGEPSGARPNSYGDPRRFTLPNSGIAVRASTLWWQDLDPRDVRLWTPPGIAVELSSTDYRNNIDPAMNAILNYASEPALTDQLLDALKNNDVPLAVKRYHEFKSNPTHVYLNTEAQMNRLGYDLMNANKTELAIEIFKLNVESYPESFNVYDSLGEAYMKLGNKELAIKNYEKTLALNPANPGARDALKTLKQ
ncbi:MAG TPA: tetratricopeptide repeat protein [Pyrinomonadaceae bacterium]|nr:tetratricopeptide repeat protein [Pyrinomonadaceae bacterium]